MDEHIERISITELPDFMFYCGEDHYFGSGDPSPANCPVCVEIEAARQGGREEVLGMACKANCLHCQKSWPIKYYPSEGNWFHHRPDGYALGICCATDIRNAYQERFGDG